jgi:hypothetical protein
MTTHNKKLPATTQHLLLGSSIGAASLAFILGLFSTSKCQFVSTSFSLRFDGAGAFDDNNPLADTTTSSSNLVQLSLGLFRYQKFGVDNGMFHVDNTCTSYATTAITVDTNWMAARTFGILTLIIGGIHLLLLLLVGVCIHSSDSGSERKMSIMKIISPWVYLLCCLFQGLTLLILNSQLCNNSNNNNNSIRQSVENLLTRATIQWSDNGCSMESGSKMATSSVVFWLLACILSFLANHFMNTMTTTVSDDLPDASSTAKNKVRDDCNREDELNDNDGNESQTRGGVQVHSSLIEDIAKKKNDDDNDDDDDDDDCQDLDEEAISPITTLKTTDSVGSKQQEQQAACSIASTPKQSSPSTNNNPSSSSIITAPPRLGIISSNNNATDTEKRSNNLSPSIVSRNNMSVSSAARVQSSSSSSVKGSYSPAGGGRRRARYR